ncbi:MAG: MBL fold metallo-hydrolase [Bacteroidales bacterium]|nr:MBL fold metallo-hydrolase [Bacteroidales bacterium]
MKITFLGTGTSQGVPVIACHCPVCQSPDSFDNRLRSAISLETEGYRLIVDCGPDFRQQMLREKIESLDAILITHGHKDHLGGLDDVRAFNYILKSPAHVYATRDVQKTIKRDYDYAFGEDRYPGVPEIILHTFHNQPFYIKGLKIIPIKSFHYNESQYVFGFRIKDFTYITDAVKIPEPEKVKIQGSKILVLNALRREKHYSHFNLEEALELMEEFKPETGFLTHISHQMGLHREVERELPSFVRLAHDGLTITF